MKTGNYAGFCDRGYKRKSEKNGDRLIEHGLRICGNVPAPTTVENEQALFERLIAKK